jgi:hypothetical protein
MMETVYEFVSSGWEDVDLDFPLTCEFSYQSTASSSSSLSSGDYLVHRPRLEVSYSSSMLPRGRRVVVGDQSELVMLSTRVRVFDSLDGRSESSASVEVLEVELSSNEVRNLLLNSLSESEGNDEIDQSWFVTVELGELLWKSRLCDIESRVLCFHSGNLW